MNLWQSDTAGPDQHPEQRELELEPGFLLQPTRAVALARQSQLTLRASAATTVLMQRSCSGLQELLQRGVPIYGETTGFGPHVCYARGDAESETHGRHLLEHLGAGAGPATPRAVVRGTILLRCLTMARGYSAVRPEIFAGYARLLEIDDLYPWVPQLGSVGASGDLVPLAHIARAITGQGSFLARNNSDAAPIAAGPILANLGVPALLPRAREALSMSNGVSYSAAWAIFALDHARRLLDRVEECAGLLYALLGASPAALDAELHRARGHIGQSESADRISGWLARVAVRPASPTASASQSAPERPLQEVYSLRCIPQIAGAVRTQLDQAEASLQSEINGVSDNPVIYYREEEAQVAHGGNFFGQQIAFASDAINQGITQLGLLVERQIALLANPAQNGGAPLLLAGSQGLDSGLAGGQLTASAIVAEMRLRCQSAATATVPTNGDNQDIVSMSPIAARSAYDQADRLAPLIAVLGISIRQLNYLREAGTAPGQTIVMPDWLADVAPLPHDRALHDDIARLSARLMPQD